MKKQYLTAIIIALCCLSLFMVSSCTRDKTEMVFPGSGYPDDVARIIVTSCAVTGCHTSNSKAAAGGLSLETWDQMFEGANGGAVVIPYRGDYSTLLYYTNTDSSKGLVSVPTMPYNAPPLSAAQYDLLSNWIQSGAPDRNGFVKFSDHEDKNKLYVCNHGCDVVAVVDPESGLVMRFVDAGASPEIEGPSMIKVSPDKLYWYVIFNLGTVIQKFRTSDNMQVGELSIGLGNWTSITITPDSKKGFITDASGNGRILYADLESMQMITTYETGLRYPFNSCLNPVNNRLYVTSQVGNYIYKVDVSNHLAPVIHEISLETDIPVDQSPSLNPNAVLFNNDGTTYFVTCQKSSELRIMQASNDSLLFAISVGSNPGSMCLSADFPYLFVSCMGAPATSKLSAIYVVNYLTGTYITEIDAGYDSKGIALDELNEKLFVANRNISSGTPAGHHAAVCDGKNGNLTAIDLNTLQLIPNYKAELSVDPYDIAGD